MSVDGRGVTINRCFLWQQIQNGEGRGDRYVDSRQRFEVAAMASSLVESLGDEVTGGESDDLIRDDSSELSR